MSVLSAIKSYCLPRNFDTALFRGYMFVYVYSWTLNSLFFALYHRNSRLAIASAIGAPLAIFATWLHEKGAKNAATALRTLSALALISFIAYETDGVRSPVLVWNFIVVLGGLLVFGEKRGFVLLVVSLAQVIVLYFFSPASEFNALAAFSFLNTIPFIYIVGVIFLRQKQFSFNRLQSEKDKVEIANQNIESILSSSPSLIAIFDSDRIIVASASFQKMFPNVEAFVPAITNIFPESVRPAMLEALDASFDNDELNFEVNYSCLPPHIEMNGADYSIKWTPICGKNGIVKRIQFEASNVSAMFAQQERAERNELIAAIFNAGIQKVRRFLPGATLHFQFVREKVQESLKTHSRDCYIRLHTMKGEARTLGFKTLADAIHKAEDGLNAVDQNLVMTSLRQAESILQSIREIALNFDAETETLSLPRVIDALRQRSERTFLLEHVPSVSSLMKARESSAVAIAKDLGKPPLQLRIEGPEARLTLEAAEALDQLLIHALRNALSHGIETVEARRAARKAEAGTFSISCLKQADHLVLAIADDGRGLALEMIQTKAERMGLIAHKSMSPQEIAELIFLPGFSTAQEVSHISGRGVGMDAIRSAMEGIGGSVRVEVLEEAPTARWRLVVHIPRIHILNWDA